MATPAPLAKATLGEADRLWPGRNRASDGICGDAAHQARKSDHNPGAAGMCHAVDITHDPDHGCDANRIFDTIVADCKAGLERRVTYVITHRKIASAKYGWVVRPYLGINPHKTHIHISLVDFAPALNSKKPVRLEVENVTPYRLTVFFAEDPEARQQLVAKAAKFKTVVNGPVVCVHGNTETGLKDIERFADEHPRIYRFHGVPVEAGTHKGMGVPNGQKWKHVTAYVTPELPGAEAIAKVRDAAQRLLDALTAFGR